MTSTATTRTSDTLVVTPPAAPSASTPVSRSTSRAVPWVLAGILAVTAVSAAAVTYRAHQDSTPATSVVTVVGDSGAAAVHGRAGHLYTVSGQPVTTTASVGTSAELRFVGHGTGTKQVLAAGHILG